MVVKYLVSLNGDDYDFMSFLSYMSTGAGYEIIMT